MLHKLKLMHNWKSKPKRQSKFQRIQFWFSTLKPNWQLPFSPSRPSTAIATILVITGTPRIRILLVISASLLLLYGFATMALSHRLTFPTQQWIETATLKPTLADLKSRLGAQSFGMNGVGRFQFPNLHPSGARLTSFSFAQLMK